MIRMLCLVALLAPICALPAQTRPLFAWPLVRSYLPPEAGPANCSVVGDVNGDGAPDLLIALKDSVKLFLNDGRGSFSLAPWVPVPPTEFNVTAMALVDVNRNGHLDLVLGDRYIEIYLNDGKGSFTRSQRMSSFFGPGITSKIVFGDLDGDGYPDLLCTTGTYIRPYVFWNNGNGQFHGDFRALPIAPSNCMSVAVGDVNGNGHLDIVVGTRTRNILLLNDGQGSFTDMSTSHMPLLEEMTWDVALTDVDGDGDLDIVCANRTGPIRLHLNDGQGRFTDVSATHLPRGKHASYKIFTGDITRNGSIDLLFAGEMDMPDMFFRNDGRGRFTDASNLLPRFYREKSTALHPVDLDWDGDLDLIVLSTGLPKIFLNDGKGKLVNATQTRMQPDSRPTAYMRHNVIADLTGNGQIDILRDGLYIGNGTGWFQKSDPQIYPNPGNALAAGDLTGNGALDLISSTRPDIPLWVNDGHGRFTNVPFYMPPHIGTLVCAAIGDVDRDGHLDLVLGFCRGNNVCFYVYINEGSGTFTDPKVAHFIGELLFQYPFQCFFSGILLADLNGNGAIDILLSSSTQLMPAQPRMLLNDGKGFFIDVTATHLPSAPQEISFFSLGDITGNGATDVLAAGKLDGGAILLINDGRGRFSISPGTAFPRGNVYDGLLGDLDGDGRLDILLCMEQSTWRNFIFRGDGKGNFQEIPEWLPPGLPFLDFVQAVDIDGDGTLDIMTNLFHVGSAFDFYHNSFLFNLTRQLHAPLLPRPGHPYRLDVYGDPARHTALPLLGSTRASTSLGPLGTLGLATQGLHALPPVFLKNEGKGTLFSAVPRDPTLYGVQLFFQALMVDRVDPGLSRLTNLVVDEVVDV